MASLIDRARAKWSIPWKQGATSNRLVAHWDVNNIDVPEIIVRLNHYTTIPKDFYAIAMWADDWLIYRSRKHTSVEEAIDACHAAWLAHLAALAVYVPAPTKRES